MPNPNPNPNAPQPHPENCTCDDCDVARTARETLRAEAMARGDHSLAPWWFATEIDRLEVHGKVASRKAKPNDPANTREEKLLRDLVAAKNQKP